MVGAFRFRSSKPVLQEMTTDLSSDEKSVPASTIHPTDLEDGGGENSLAPMAENVPAPPRMSFFGV